MHISYLGLVSALAVAACSQVPALAKPTGEFLPMEAPSDWRAVDPENLILLETPYGEVVLELNADFAPGHAEQFRALARSGVYDGEAFYRVIDGFVAQGGLQDGADRYEPIPNENDRPISDATFVPLGNDDLFAEHVGHVDGFAVGRSYNFNREWLLHCPGALAMARDTDPDTGGTEFYIVLDAQRYLDRNLTIFGRVIDGFEYIQKLKRGERAIESGVIQPPEKGDAIMSMKVAADLPESDRPAYEVMVSDSAAFEAAKTEKRVREEDFFYRKPPEILDICGFEVPVRSKAG